MTRHTSEGGYAVLPVTESMKYCVKCGVQAHGDNVQHREGCAWVEANTKPGANVFAIAQQLMELDPSHLVTNNNTRICEDVRAMARHILSEEYGPRPARLWKLVVRIHRDERTVVALYANENTQVAIMSEVAPNEHEAQKRAKEIKAALGLLQRFEVRMDIDGVREQTVNVIEAEDVKDCIAKLAEFTIDLKVKDVHIKRLP